MSRALSAWVTSLGVFVCAALFGGCPAPAPRGTTPTPPAPSPPVEPPAPVAPPAAVTEIRVRAVEGGAEIVVGDEVQRLDFEVAARWPALEVDPALPVRVDGDLVLLTIESPAPASPEPVSAEAPPVREVRWVARVRHPAVARDGLSVACADECRDVRAGLDAAGRALPGRVLDVRVDGGDAPRIEVGRGWVVRTGGAPPSWEALFAASAVPGPGWWRLGVARYLALTEAAIATDAPTKALLRALSEAYTRHRTAPRPIGGHGESHARDIDGAALLAFCADLQRLNPRTPNRGATSVPTEPTAAARPSFPAPPLAAARFRGVFELDGCLRSAGLRLLALRIPRYDATMRRRLFGGATVEGSPPTVVRSPGPLRPGDVLHFLNGVRLRTPEDVGLALHGRRRDRVILTYEREGQRRRQWITIPRLDADDEDVRFVIDAPSRWTALPRR